METWPPVSVIMPVRNEEPYLVRAVQGVLDQEYPGRMEIVLAVGPSDDRTEEIAAKIAADDDRIQLVSNPDGRTPHALNAAIGASTRDVIVRVDGHGMLSAGYIKRAVEALGETGAANVGGIMQAEGETDFERAVARAMTSPFGIGSAAFHVGGEAGPADTVYLGTFRRDVLERLGGYDEHFIRAQDWELNYRIRAAGELIWFTPDLTVSYRPRPTLAALARQFFRSGMWRREVMRRYPHTANVRYLAPPVVAVGLGVGTAAGVAAQLGAPGWLALGWAAPVAYGLGVLAAGLAIGRGLPVRARMWLPAVLATMHITWGAGFLTRRRPE
jgi:glycosyltransferase involved in cell wall biosynthesis